HHDSKVVVICHHQKTARGLEGHLRLREGLATAQFHEDMDLVERDRAAAYFADPEGGAEALICSEIGSEGRNFQFAHTLVCFDLPPHPDLLEQRIGRLDRIGQTHPIDLHVPYFTDHASEYWFRWYHEGLNGFEQTCAVGAAVLKQTLHTLPAPHSLLDLPISDPVDFEAQLAVTQQLAERLNAQLKAGKHRLLEWHSFNRAAAKNLVETVSAFETQASPESVILEALESFGVEIEDEGHGIFGVQPGNKMIPDSFPFVSEDGGRITFRRNIALSRDDVRFITWEHPLVQFVLETLDSAHLGAAGVTLISLPQLPKGTLYLEANFLPLMQHPARYRASRHLPQALYRKIVDQTGQ
ncbi:MAG: helicase-related protein, partial [Natronospirillum sp.]